MDSLLVAWLSFSVNRWMVVELVEMRDVTTNSSDVALIIITCLIHMYLCFKCSLSYRYTACTKRLGWCEATTSSFRTHKEIIAHCSSETKRGIWSRDVIFLTGCIKSCQNIPVQRETKHRSSLSVLRLGCCPYPIWWVWQHQATSKSVPPCVSALQVNARQATFCDDQSSHIRTTSF